MRLAPFVTMLCITLSGNAQENELLDSLYIEEVENLSPGEKVLHAEPLFIDLIRDLGARKGEKEWNVGIGMTDNNTFDEYVALVEYEWAPINRLGLEIELPLSFYYASEKHAAPKSQLNSLKAATQYSFLVKERYKMSMALGYIHELELRPIEKKIMKKPISGNVFNPFYVLAKRWGNNFHSLIYAGPVFQTHADHPGLNTMFQWNSNFHYMIPGTRNFVGIEVNKEWLNKDFDMVIRPQMRVGITERTLLGIVTGIPINRENQRLSMFLRLIYEVGHSPKKHG